MRELSAMVCDGDLSGLFVHGPGGLGKSFAVRQALEEAGIENPRVLNSHATPRGLYDELYEARGERVILIEDLEELLSNLQALQLLRAALWGDLDKSGAMKRTITWTTAASGENGVPNEFEIQSGVILTANRLPGGPIFSSLATRVPIVQFEVAPDEVFSFMRQMVKPSGRAVVVRRKSVQLSARQCEEVITHLETRGATDLRALHHGLTLYARDSKRWRSLLDTILAAAVSAAPKPARAGVVARPDNKALRQQELVIARELAERDDLNPETRVEQWVLRAKRSRATYYRRVAELQSG